MLGFWKFKDLGMSVFSVTVISLSVNSYISEFRYFQPLPIETSSCITKRGYYLMKLEFPKFMVVLKAEINTTI